MFVHRAGRLGLPERYVAASGGLEARRGLDQLIAAMNHVHPAVSLLPVGPEADDAALAALVAESGVASYEYAIGTSPSDPGEGYVAPWTAAGPAESWTVDTLTLQPGTRYYWYVRATNGADLVSDVGVSDGIVPVSVAAETPAEAKLEADGVFLSAAGTVTATSAQLDGRIYIEAPDRSSGIACLSTDACAVGDSVIVAGTMATDGGERVISGAGILASQAAVPVAPHTMTLRSVAGGDFFYDAQTGAGQRGVSIPCLLYTSPSPRDRTRARMPSSA